MKAKSIKGRNADEIGSRLTEAMADGFAPTLAIVFLSIKQDRNAIVKLLDVQNISVFGSTTAGEFIDGEVEEESTVMMLLDMDKSSFVIDFQEATEITVHKTATKIAEAAKQRFSKPAFLIASAMFTNGDMIVQGIEDSFDSDVTMFGGLAGDDLTNTGAYVFINAKMSNSALVALVIDEEKIAMKGMATSGWKPVGTVKTITKSEAGILYTIDGQPALDVFLKFLGGTVSEINESAVLNDAGAFYPILLLREGGDPVVRSSMFANKKDRSLTFGGSVPEGSKMCFSLPPDFDVVERVVEDSTKIKQDQLSEADAIVVFSCVARKITLGPLIGEEIEGIRNVWNAPVAGFFSYGEIGKSLNGKYEFHNNTCCMIALKELSN